VRAQSAGALDPGGYFITLPFALRVCGPNPDFSLFFPSTTGQAAVPGRQWLKKRENMQIFMRTTVGRTVVLVVEPNLLVRRVVSLSACCAPAFMILSVKVQVPFRLWLPATTDQCTEKSCAKRQVSDVKARLQEHDNIPADDQFLMWGGRVVSAVSTAHCIAFLCDLLCGLIQTFLHVLTA